MAAITSGNALKGLRYLPVFILSGLAIYFIVVKVLGAIFVGIGAAA